MHHQLNKKKKKNTLKHWANNSCAKDTKGHDITKKVINWSETVN